MDAFSTPGALFAAAGKLNDEVALAMMAVSIAHHLPPSSRPPLLTQAIAWARNSTSQFSRVSAFTAMLPLLEAFERASVAEEALSAALEIDTDVLKADALAALACWLDGASRQAAIEAGMLAVRQIDPAAHAVAEYEVGPDSDYVDEQVAWTLNSLAGPVFRFALATQDADAELLQEALNTLYRLDHFRQAAVLEDVAALLPESTVIDLLQDIACSEKSTWRRQILEALLARWAEFTSPEQALERARLLASVGLLPLSRASQDSSEPDRPETPETPKALADSASEDITVTVKLDGSYISLAFRLTKDGAEEGFAVHLEQGKTWQSEAQQEGVTSAARAEAVSHFLSSMNQKDVGDALKKAEEWGSTRWRQAKVALISRLLQLGNVTEAVRAANCFWGEDLPPELVAALIPHLEPVVRRPLLSRGLLAAQARDEPAERASALAAISEHLVGDERRSVIDEALDSLREALRNEDWRPGAFKWRAEHFVTASRSSLYATWVEALGRRSLKRNTLLSRLSGLWPLAEALAGARISEDAPAVLAEIVQWWP